MVWYPLTIPENLEVESKMKVLNLHEECVFVNLGNNDCKQKRSLLLLFRNKGNYFVFNVYHFIDWFIILSNVRVQFKVKL